jgi:PAP2 superfamily
VKRAVLTLMLAGAGLLGAWVTLPAATAQTAAEPTRAAAPAPDPAIQWNQFLLGIQATPGDQPATVHPTYELAIMHAAIYDAVVAIDRSATPYLTTVHGPGDASLAAAADTAARDTLITLYPSLQGSIDQEYAGLVAQLPSRRRVSEGIHVGKQVAAQLLAARRGDGSSAPPIPLEPGTNPGDYQLTPPSFSPPVFTQWRFVRPFTLRRADQFRPAPPPALTSAKYAAAINEVKTLGAAQGSTRTADQTEIGLFWNPPIWATWNRIAQTAAVEHRGTLSENARTFAVLNLTFADSVIAFYDAKYTYRLWRPVTAIQHADTDGNPDTTADPNWAPLSVTAPDPSYPGAHGTISAAGAETLSSIYGNDFAFTVTSTALPGVERPFTSFSEAAEEATMSRIYNGNHTHIDQVAGENLGRDVAQFVLGTAFLRHDQRGR